MKRTALLVAAAVVVLGGAASVMAANPSPSRAATAKPAPSAGSSALSAAPAQVFRAQVNPLQITGTASVKELANGGGVMTLTLSGLLDARRWSVDVEAGTIAQPNERVEIAFRAGADVSRLASDTIRIQLTKAEMAAFLKAEAHGGVVAVVSDGALFGYAQFGA